jgi:hypothetical protein
MKRLSLSIFIIAVLSFMSPSCKKKNDTPAAPPTVAQQVLGKWKVYRTVETNYFPINVQVSQDIEFGEPGDSIIFKTDNKAYTYLGGIADDTSVYSIPNDSTLIMQGLSFKIKKINAAEFNFLISETFGGVARTDLLFELKK